MAGEHEPEVLDNSTYWIDIDPETGLPDLSSVHGVEDYITADGTHFTIVDGEAVVTVPGPNDD